MTDEMSPDDNREKPTATWQLAVQTSLDRIIGSSVQLALKRVPRGIIYGAI